MESTLTAHAQAHAQVYKLQTTIIFSVEIFDNIYQRNSTLECTSCRGYDGFRNGRLLSLVARDIHAGILPSMSPPFVLCLVSSYAMRATGAG